MIKNNYYYVEGLHKELFGVDNFGVGVIFPNGTWVTPITEEYCYYYYKSSTYQGNWFFVFNISCGNEKLLSLIWKKF